MATQTLEDAQYRLDNGGFKIEYTRQVSKNRLSEPVNDRSEVEGYDDWICNQR